jgi:hypothetical protein
MGLSGERSQPLFEGIFVPLGWATLFATVPGRTLSAAGGGEIKNPGESLMSVSTKALLAAGAAVLIGLSSVAMAQTKKSTQATSMGEGEAIMIHPKGGVHKSAAKVTAAQHEAAMKKGAREIKPGAVIYHQGGKLYMLEDSANETASSQFQNQFDVDY